MRIIILVFATVLLIQNNITSVTSSSCSVENFGDNLVATEQGNNVGHIYQSSLENCKSRCKAILYCHSFVYCAYESSCHLKDKILYGSEDTFIHGGCTTYFNKCDPCSSTPCGSKAICLSLIHI